jgi:hypothetical protein
MKPEHYKRNRVCEDCKFLDEHDEYDSYVCSKHDFIIEDDNEIYTHNCHDFEEYE